MKKFIPQYVNALKNEVKIFQKIHSLDVIVNTLFFGGGTPSLMLPSQIDEILKVIRENFQVACGAEITLEANPGTVDPQRIDEYRKIGVNRLSFGMQSANPNDLRILDREHKHQDVINAVKWGKRAGFEHINLDLIFGIPGQSLDRWKQNLELAVLENVDHLSLYSLSIEDGTPLKDWVDHGISEIPDDDLGAEMYEYAMDFLDQKGFLQYEISNWARKSNTFSDSRCQHNLQTWRYQPYLGFGAGAHGFFEGTRTENVGGILPYIGRIAKASNLPDTKFPASILTTPMTHWDQMQEFLMVGFRLTDEGVDLKEFETRFGKKAEIVFKKEFDFLKNRGLVEQHPDNIYRTRLTRLGKLFGNQVFSQFVGNSNPDHQTS